MSRRVEQVSGPGGGERRTLKQCTAAVVQGSSSRRPKGAVLGWRDGALLGPRLAVISVEVAGTKKGSREELQSTGHTDYSRRIEFRLVQDQQRN